MLGSGIFFTYSVHRERLFNSQQQKRKTSRKTTCTLQKKRLNRCKRNKWIGSHVMPDSLNPICAFISLYNGITQPFCAEETSNTFFIYVLFIVFFFFLLSVCEQMLVRCPGTASGNPNNNIKCVLSLFFFLWKPFGSRLFLFVDFLERPLLMMQHWK